MRLDRAGGRPDGCPCRVTTGRIQLPAEEVAPDGAIAGLKTLPVRSVLSIPTAVAMSASHRADPREGCGFV